MEGQLHTPACDLLGCQYPVVLAGMGGVARSELVTAVTNAGGYGFLGMVRESPELIEREIRRVRAGTNREFGINVIPAATSPELLEKQIDICIKQRIASVCLFWDVDVQVIKRLRDAGIIVVHQVGSLQDADEALTAGAHMLIVQGVEAGGHVRGKLPLGKLLKKVLPDCSVPVLAAGGVVDGNDLAELIRAGAHGVVIGTAFLATNESYAHDYHKQQVINVRQDESLLTNLFHINWPFGAFTRVLPNSVTKNADLSNSFVQGARDEIGEDSGKPIYLYSTDSPLQSSSGDLERMAIYAGCGAHRIDSIVPASVRLQSIVDKAWTILSGRKGDDSLKIADKQFYSSPCYSSEVNPKYSGLASDSETIHSLQELLSAERAGARVAVRSMLECDNEEYRKFFSQIYTDEVRWCKMLIVWISQLGGQPEFKIGDFYNRAMNIENYPERIHFLNKGQVWVTKKIKAISPTINIVQLQEDLQDMLTNHFANVVLAKKQIGD